MVINKKINLLAVLVIASLFLISCIGSSTPPLNIHSHSRFFWGGLEADAIYESQALGGHLLISTDRGLAAVALDAENPQARWLIRSKGKIVNHTLFSPVSSDKIQYFYIEQHRLRFYDILPGDGENFPSIQLTANISTRRYGDLLDGVNPSRMSYAPDGSLFYIARYAQVLLFHTDGSKTPGSPVLIPNFVSYFAVDDDYFFYRTFMRQFFSTHMLGALDMHQKEEVWRNQYGPDYQDWEDIVDSFPLMDEEGRLFFVIRAYPHETFDQEGLMIVEELEKATGKVIRHWEWKTKNAAGTGVPIGPMHIVDHHLIGEVHGPSMISSIDLHTSEILWTTDVEHNPLQMIHIRKDQQWALLLGNGSIVFLDEQTGEIMRRIETLDLEIEEYSYGSVHLMENGNIAGHLNNKAAFTEPRSIFFYLHTE